MPVVNLNKKAFEKFIERKLPIDKLKERISMLGTDLKEINDKEIIVEVFPNRPDMLSEQGFARAFSSFVGNSMGMKKYDAGKSGYKVIVDSNVNEVRPFTACCVVKNLKLDDERIREIMQIQEKLHVTYGRNRQKVAIGVYPMEKIKWPIKYESRKPKNIFFRPLGSKFAMNGKDILSKNPTGIQYGYLLENYKRYPIFVDAENKILSMPPVINSDDTGRIDSKTRDIFIEVSGFNFNVLSICLNIIATALSDMNGEVYEVNIRYGNKVLSTPDFSGKKIKFDLDYANRVLGLDLSKKEAKKYLEMMGFGYNDKEVFIPCYRADIMHQIDIVEDISIAYGYENFKGEIPKIDTIGHEDNFEKFKNIVADTLVGFGLIETNSYNLIGKKDQLDKMNIKSEVVDIKNSNEEYNSLRSWIIPSLMKILSSNKHNEYHQKIFEIGNCFRISKSETNVEEFSRVGVLICHSKADYTEARQILNSLMGLFGLKCELDEAEHESFISGRCARVSVNGKDVAYLGELHPEIISNFNLEVPVVGFELNLTELFEMVK